MPMRRRCLTCRKVFMAKTYAVKNGEGKYCSMSCRSRSYVGPRNGRWKGGRVKGPDGRMLVHAPWHPRATLCGSKYILEYRLIAEQKLGRRLRRNEIVHHINGDKTDNAPANLEVMTRRQHIERHRADMVAARRAKK